MRLKILFPVILTHMDKKFKNDIIKEKEGIMKKIFILLFVFFCLISFAEISKEEFLKKVVENYKDVPYLSGEIEMKMDMMGKVITMPMKFWKKDKKFKMEMTYQQPGMEQEMEISMLFDGKKMLQYQKLTNTVIKFDLTKFPDDLRNEWEKKYDFGKTSISDLEKISSNLKVSEKIKNGKNYYVLTVENLQSLKKDVPALKGKNVQFFNKVIAWLHKDNLVPEKISFYADTERPGMEIIFKSLSKAPIKDSVFKLDIPEDAKIMDMTDMMVNMIKKMKEQQTPQK